ncbi:MAG: phosphoribosyltransferase family protein [bacterium]|nr:phosphoribosyltransferase family protein [bacterium]
MNRHLERLKKAGALVPGHFVFVSGQHSGWYVNKTAALVLASDIDVYAHAIADHFPHRRLHFEDIAAVVYPELGAIPLGALVAHQLYMGADAGYDFPGIVATKVVKGDNLVGYEIARDQRRFLGGKRTLVVEDVITTGLSVRMTMEAIRSAGGIPVAVAALWMRNPISAEEFGVETAFALINERLPDYTEDECPQCRENIPINTDLGKGKAYLDNRYPDQ